MAATVAQFATTTALNPVPLTAADRETVKSRQHKAEDWIYTMNHAVTCLSITDLMIAPLVGAVSMKTLGKRIDLCGHPDHHHDHDHGHGHDHHKDSFILNFWKKDYWAEVGTNVKAGFAELREGFGTKAYWKDAWKGSKPWLISEVIGDVGAVPITILTQRYAPSFMHGLRKLTEPVVGGIFKRRATAAAEAWADKNGIDRTAQECVDHAEKLYEYEMRHLPQMAMWTVGSVGINYAIMKHLNKDMTLGAFAKGKVGGTAVTAGLVLGARAFSPATAHAWDEFAGKHVVMPVTKAAGKLVGISDRDIDDFHAREHEKPKSRWADRVAEADAPAEMAAR